MRKIKSTVSYKEELFEALQSPIEASEYLNAALDDEDERVFLLALKDVAEARGGMSKLAKASGLNRVSLYRTLSKGGNPEMRSVDKVLHALGLKIEIKAA